MDVLDELDQTVQEAQEGIGGDVLDELVATAVPEVPSPVQEIPVEPEEKGLFGRTGELLEKRQESAKEYAAKAARGEVTEAEAIGDVIGQSAGLYLDVVGEYITTGLKQVAENSPENLNAAVGEGFKTFINAIPQEIRVALSSTTRDAVDVYQELEEENPRTMRQVENIFNTLMVAAPATKGNPSSKPGMLSQLGTKAQRKGKVQYLANRRENIFDLIRPEKYPTNTTSRSPKLMLNAEQDVARTTQTGMLGTKTRAPTKFEIKVAKDVSRVPGLRTSKNELHAANKINAHKKALSQKLDDQLLKLPPPKSSLVQKGINEIDTTIDAWMKDQVFLTGQKGQVEAIKQKAKALLLASDDTAHGVRRARIEFDEWAQDLKIPMDLEKAVGAVNTKIRNSMNDIVSIEAKKHGINAKRIQENIHHLIEANKIIAPKAQKIGANALVRLGENARKIVGARNAALGVAATALGTTVIGAAQMAAAPIGISVGLGISAAATLKALKSPAAKRGVGALLKATDDALKVATDPTMIRKLRADRVLALELYNSLEGGVYEGYEDAD